jgi:hemerythrin superfamily protein
MTMDALSRVPCPDAIRLLMADHQEIDVRFERYSRLREGAQAGDDTRAEREHLALQLCTLLVVHATIEEEVFYPAARATIDEPLLIDEASVEHATVKALINEIRATSPGAPFYDARIEVLRRYVRQHVCEEENVIFPHVRRTSLDLVTLGRRLHHHREALLAEATLPEQGELPA